MSSGFAFVSTMATVIGGTFSRLQFTPDLVPADIVGTRIWRPSREEFDIEWGPVFANVVLADEINRAPAKVQSALLEVMAERQVSIGGVTHPLPSPFLVLATQNPIESEGVYPLPEAQRDRFLMRVSVPYPTASDELEIAFTERVMGNQSPIESPLMSAIERWVAANDPGASAVPLILQGFSDSKWFRDAFPKCVAYGFFPMRHQTLLEATPLMHNADERIDVRDLGFAATFYADIARELLS